MTEWYDVNVNLPEEDVPVLCADERFMYVARRRGSHFELDDRYGDSCKPTHWCNLPELPDGRHYR